MITKYLDKNGAQAIIGSIKSDIETNAQEVSGILETLNEQIANNASTESVTYEELALMVHDKELVPGTWYRIIDYVTTVDASIDYARSLEIPFDVIVRAVDPETLCEEGYAARSQNDKDYFIGSDLSAWKIWYNLDNMHWSNSSGAIISNVKVNNVVYYRNNEKDIEGSTNYYSWKSTNDDWMWTTTETPAVGDNVYIDRSGSDTPQASNLEVSSFSVDQYNPKASGGKGTIYRMIDENDNDCPYDFKNIQFKRPLNSWVYNPDNGTDAWVYTFCGINTRFGVITDLSLNRSEFCRNNKIGNNSFDSAGLYFVELPNNVFVSSASVMTQNGTIRDNEIGMASKDNTFTDLAIKNNRIGYRCVDNIIYGVNNTLENNCHDITINTNSSGNAFGHGCSNVVLPANSVNNVFGNNCFDIEIENSASYNKFGSFCSDVTLFDANKNIFGAGCIGISMGSCNNCYFSAGTSNVESTYQYGINNLIIEPGVKCVSIECTSEHEQDGVLNNITISSGVEGEADNYLTISHPSENDNYRTLYRNNEEGELESGIIPLNINGIPLETVQNWFE